MMFQIHIKDFKGITQDKLTTEPLPVLLPYLLGDYERVELREVLGSKSGDLLEELNGNTRLCLSFVRLTVFDKFTVQVFWNPF
jgi:hypothetical protein